MCFIGNEDGLLCHLRRHKKEEVTVGIGKPQGSLWGLGEEDRKAAQKGKTCQPWTDGMADLDCQPDCAWNLLRPQLLGTL